MATSTHSTRTRNLIMIQRICVLLLIQCLQVRGAFTKYFFFCSLSSQRLVVVNATVLEDGTMNYQEVQNENENNGRFLRRSEESFIATEEEDRWEKEATNWPWEIENDNNNGHQDGVSALRLLSGFQSSEPPGTSVLLRVRSCPCAPAQMGTTTQSYCPAQLAYCAVPGNYYSNPSDPVCLNVPNDEIFVRSVWPIILIWFALTIVFCMCTWSGRNACDFVIGCICPCWNRFIFHAVAQPPDENSLEGCWSWCLYHRRGYLQDRYSGIVGRARLAEDGVTTENGRGFEYEVRTRRFQLDENKEGTTTNEADNTAITSTLDEKNPNDPEEDASEDDDNRASCAICFLALEHGDRVGEIDCGHLFHVDCLKGWLTRRNVCPLCLDEGVAKPKGYHSLQRRTATSSPQQDQDNAENCQSGDQSAGPTEEAGPFREHGE